MVATDDFRQELLYRINTLEIHFPPLRDRIEDNPQLAQHLLSPHRKHVSTDPVQLERYIDDSSIKVLQSHAWPGNIRDLANVVEHASILAARMPISAEDLPHYLSNASPVNLPSATAGKSLREIEMETIAFMQAITPFGHFCEFCGDGSGIKRDLVSRQILASHRRQL